jgi:hypothetical protein
MSLGLLVSLVLVVAACGEGSEESDRGPDDPVLQISSEGGFAPMELLLNTGPRYTVLGDRRLVFQGVQTMQFPGPLVPPYMVTQMSESQMNAVMAMVGRIGLSDIDDETDDSAASHVADATTEVITFWDAGGTHRYSVYALGIEQAPGERNAAFLELIDTFDRFTAETPAEPYEPERARVIWGPANADVEDIRPWPLDDDWAAWADLPNGWKCRGLDAVVLESFGDANQATQWEISDTSSGYSGPAQLLVRPLLPGEPDCPENS